MKNVNGNLKAFLSPHKAAQDWLERHSAMNFWLTRAMMWLSFAVMIMNRN